MADSDDPPRTGIMGLHEVHPNAQTDRQEVCVFCDGTKINNSNGPH